MHGVRQGDSLSPMLFVIAMYVLHRLFTKAARDGVLRKMKPPEIKFQCSLYADDVILFNRPSVQEVTVVKEIMEIFSDASGLRTNLAKCSITPTYGAEDTLNQIVAVLGCQVQPFPIRYLELPLSTKKIPKAHYQAVVEVVARKMPPCHGALMARSGRLVWIKSVLRSVPIYAMITENLPPWAQKEIDSITRKFFWAGSNASVQGKCMVSWLAVCRPTELGGLGISDLKLAGFALQTKWLWLQKIDRDRAWSQLLIQTAPEVQTFFKASMFTIVGDGRHAVFWDDRWIDSESPVDIALCLVQLVTRRTRRSMTVREGITDRAWTRRISGGFVGRRGHRVHAPLEHSKRLPVN